MSSKGDFMKINSVLVFSNNNINTVPSKQNVKPSKNNNSTQNITEPIYFKIPNNVLFTGETTRQRILDVDFYSYKNLRLGQRQILRKQYKNFENLIDKEELANPNNPEIPLKNEVVMKHFIDVCKKYTELKDEPILCLGRSPKWFLNGAYWLNGGLYQDPPYKGVAFSKSWYRYGGPECGMVRNKFMAPTEEEKKAYKRYLKRIQADPKSIIKKAQETGKKYVITDYISTGKGVTSFLDLMSEYAEEDNVLDEFAHSIRIFGIGCNEYRERMFYDDEEISATPKVQMPERLMPYNKIITQDYYDMPLDVFEEMLINENSNECRSTYYPHETWTLYSPNRFRTGMLKEKTIKELQKTRPKKSQPNYTPAMRDFRNLLNFRILDYMDRNDLLKDSLEARQQD